MFPQTTPPRLKIQYAMNPKIIKNANPPPIAAPIPRLSIKSMLSGIRISVYKYFLLPQLRSKIHAIQKQGLDHLTNYSLRTKISICFPVRSILWSPFSDSLPSEFCIVPITEQLRDFSKRYDPNPFYMRNVHKSVLR